MSDVELWACPDCGFTFDAVHIDMATGEHSCPACAEIYLERQLGEVTEERDAALAELKRFERFRSRLERWERALAREVCQPQEDRSHD